MKALSLTQPWATLVAMGAKRIETRSWYTAHRGPLAIHAAKGFPKWAQDMCEREPFCTVLAQANLTPTNLLRGVIVATCQLVDVVRITSGADNWRVRRAAWLDYHFYLTKNERAFGDYTPGRYVWLLADITPLATPIPARGALGMWRWEPTAVQP